MLHPITDQDIYSMPAGTCKTSTKDGWFLSDEYVKEVMDAKVEL